MRRDRENSLAVIVKTSRHTEGKWLGRAKTVGTDGRPKSRRTRNGDVGEPMASSIHLSPGDAERGAWHLGLPEARRSLPMREGTAHATVGESQDEEDGQATDGARPTPGTGTGGPLTTPASPGLARIVTKGSTPPHRVLDRPTRDAPETWKEQPRPNLDYRFDA